MKKENVFIKYQFIIGVIGLGVLLYLHEYKNDKPNQIETKIDTVMVENKSITDSLINEIALLNEELAKAKIVMSEREQQALVRLEQIKHYVAITKKREQNEEFFMGWIERALK